MLHHLSRLSLAKILINTYRNDVNMFISNETLFSSDGTTQDDPLAMAMYAISTIPLIMKLEDEAQTQVWYADDAAAGGSLSSLRRWWDNLISLGPKYGYFPNATKSWLVEFSKLAADTFLTLTSTSQIPEGDFLELLLGLESMLKIL